MLFSPVLVGSPSARQYLLLEVYIPFYIIVLLLYETTTKSVAGWYIRGFVSHLDSLCPPCVGSFTHIHVFSIGHICYHTYIIV